MTSSDPAESAVGWPAIGLEVDPSLSDLARHLAREYGDPRPGAVTDPSLVLSPLARARVARAGDNGAVRATRYKTTRWRVRLAAPDDQRLRCDLQVQGVFGRSLVQSTLIEPLLSVVLARRQEALVSASGIVVGGHALAIAGVSRSGKSTLAVRAWGNGRRILADDRLIVTGDGRVRGFRRRLRLYPDLVRTAPAAAERLGPAVRRRLGIAGLVRRGTRGWVGLPVLVDPSAVGVDGQASVPLGRLVVVDRSDDAATTDVRLRDEPDKVWSLLERIVRRDLAWVSDQGPAWQAAADAIAASQVDILRAAVRASGAAVAALSVPSSWDAPRAIAAVSRAVGLEP